MKILKKHEYFFNKMEINKEIVNLIINLIFK